MLFSKPKRAIGLDIGTHSVKAVQMSRSRGKLHIDEVGYATIDRNRFNSDPISAQAESITEALRAVQLKGSILVAALPGQTVVIRYPRLPDVPLHQLDEAVEREAGKNIPYDLEEVYLDWSKLTEIEENEERQVKILLVAAKHEVIDSRLEVLDAANVQPAVLGVDCLAVADAAEACDYLRVGETVALINIGHSSASIHFLKDGISNFIRDVSWGARELLQAIAKDRRVELDEAERIFKQADDEARNPAPEPEPTPESEAPAESTEIPDASGFGDDPFGNAGGSLLDPLDDEGASPLGGPASGMGMAEKTVNEVINISLARMVSEIRRSFDYYEHQLYEQPVDRIILSGGIANNINLQKTLRNELGIESVEAADPGKSALRLGNDAAIMEMKQQPAQFLVATGLAARGMADL